MKKMSWWYLASLLFVSLTFTACSKDEEPEVPVVEEPEEIEFSEVSDFVWRGLNHWYFWQNSLPALADSKLNDLDAYHTYLNSYSTPEQLFNALVNRSVDDFSWYIPDVAEQLKQFAGTNKSYGVRLGGSFFQDGNGVYIHIAYTVPDSPASLAGLERGDIIYKVDGTVMNVDNYQIINNLFEKDNITLGVGRYTEGVFTPTKEVNITRIEYSATPNQYHTVLNRGNKKVGYFVYTGFKYPYHQQLNDVFAEFKAQGINELVLDLRYNGGGTVITSALLASMIDGSRPAESSNSIFADLRYNTKRNDAEGSVYPFFNVVYLYNDTGNFTGTIPMSRLSGITKLYVLTSPSTASASEMIINGLRPYMEVITIGGTTVGKNEGSITVVDSPPSYSDPSSRKTTHTVGMQPIVFQIFNADGDADYGDGFVPLIELDEMDFAKDIKAFGDPTEPFLAAALNLIEGGTSARTQKFSQGSVRRIGGPIKQPWWEQEMYLLPSGQDFKR